MRISERRKGGVVCALAAGALLASPSAVSAQDDTPSDHLAAIKACQVMTDPSARLACYDEAAESMISASEKGELRVIDRAEVRSTRRKLFGFSLPDLGIFGKQGNESKDEEEEFSTLNTTIASVGGSYNSGFYILHTAEGAVWKIDDIPRRMLTPKPGQSLEIRKGALSSYFLRINGRGGVKGVRIQ